MGTGVCVTHFDFQNVSYHYTHGQSPEAVERAVGAQRREELWLLAEPAQREKAVASHKAGEGDRAQPVLHDTKGHVLFSGDGETVGV